MNIYKNDIDKLKKFNGDLINNKYLMEKENKKISEKYKILEVLDIKNKKLNDDIEE